MTTTTATTQTDNSSTPQLTAAAPLLLGTVKVGVPIARRPPATSSTRPLPSIRIVVPPHIRVAPAAPPPVVKQPAVAVQTGKSGVKNVQTMAGPSQPKTNPPSPPPQSLDDDDQSLSVVDVAKAPERKDVYVSKDAADMMIVFKDTVFHVNRGVMQNASQMIRTSTSSSDTRATGPIRIAASFSYLPEAIVAEFLVWIHNPSTVISLKRHPYELDYLRTLNVYFDVRQEHIDAIDEAICKVGVKNIGDTEHICMLGRLAITLIPQFRQRVASSPLRDKTLDWCASRISDFMKLAVLDRVKPTTTTNIPQKRKSPATAELPNPAYSMLTDGAVAPDMLARIFCQWGGLPNHPDCHTLLASMIKS